MGVAPQNPQKGAAANQKLTGAPKQAAPGKPIAAPAPSAAPTAAKPAASLTGAPKQAALGAKPLAAPAAGIKKK